MYEHIDQVREELPNRFERNGRVLEISGRTVEMVHDSGDREQVARISGRTISMTKRFAAAKRTVEALASQYGYRVY